MSTASSENLSMIGLLQNHFRCCFWVKFEQNSSFWWRLVHFDRRHWWSEASYFSSKRWYLAKWTTKPWKNNFWSKILNFTDFERRLDTIYVVHKGVETIQYERINFRFAVPCNFLIKSLMLGTLTEGKNSTGLTGSYHRVTEPRWYKTVVTFGIPKFSKR